MRYFILFYLTFKTVFTYSQNIGINNTVPKAKLDVSGDLILKSADLTMADGNTLDLDVNTNKFNHYKLLGPTGNFQIGGITAAEHDRIITLYNRAGHSLEVYNDDVTAIDSNRILTGTGGTFAVYPGGSVTLKYDNTINKWEITASHYNSLDNFGEQWLLNGTDISNLNSGNIGIGISTPSEKLDVAGHINVNGEIKTNGTGGLQGDVLTSNGNGSMQWSSIQNNSSEDVGFGVWGCDMQNLSDYNPVFASDGLPLDGFGNDASMEGDLAIIGAKNVKINNNDNQGAAYIFKFINNVWVEQQKLIASDGVPNDLFGTSVAISGNWAIVGAPKADINGTVDRGAAYLFYFNGSSWIQHTKYIDPNGNINDQYAFDVDIFQNQLAISVIANNFDEGAVQTYLYDGITWNPQQLIIPNDNLDGYNFGASISIYNNHLVVGVPASNHINFNEGSVYFFNFNGNTWIQINKFYFPVSEQNTQFGKSVSLDGNNAIVGSLQDKIQFFKFNNQWQALNNYTQIGSTIVSITNDYAITTTGKILKTTGNFWYYYEKANDPKGTSNNAIFSTAAISNDRFVMCAPTALGSMGMAIFGKVRN